jgi:hypothetical protein
MLYTTGWHSHFDCLCYNNVQSDGWITMFCVSILLVCRGHSAVTNKMGHSLVSSSILWTQICPVQLWLACKVRYWQRNTFILPVQREPLYTAGNVFTFIWVQRFNITKLMRCTLDLAQTRNCPSLCQVISSYVIHNPLVSS